MGNILKITTFLIFILPLHGHSITVKVFFSPDGGAQEAIIEKINEARREILVAMYCFTSRPLARALVRARERGVNVKVMLDRDCAKDKYSKEEYLRKNGIMVKLSPERSGLLSRFFQIYPPKMHHKFAVIDENVLITGSYNWTRTAEISNWENILLFEDAGELALEYKKEFERLWNWEGKK